MICTSKNTGGLPVKIRGIKKRFYNTFFISRKEILTLLKNDHRSKKSSFFLTCQAYYDPEELKIK